MKEEAERLAKKTKKGEEGSDTEVDDKDERVGGKSEDLKRGQGVAGVEPEEMAGEVRQRGEKGGSTTPVGTQSSVSTEDEWEKVSESEKEKDK